MLLHLTPSNLPFNRQVGPSCYAQVSFQWKNPYFLFKNPDFLFKNPDFLCKNVDFIIQQRLRVG